ncbi:hypothetical protein PoB_005342800 [Plakobranchus ocellatus]|uniref:Uncharacterized protein n=1 Tax=Plakobranchus ocellatus TaxID=259542 RepID=A0AAV4C7D5_9GAST|nr:hypothetical protein PoB_005342800 [Plakobranchus ocellatus]
MCIRITRHEHTRETVCSISQINRDRLVAGWLIPVPQLVFLSSPPNRYFLRIRRIGGLYVSDCRPEVFHNEGCDAAACFPLKVTLTSIASVSRKGVLSILSEECFLRQHYVDALLIRTLRSSEWRSVRHPCTFNCITLRDPELDVGGFRGPPFGLSFSVRLPFRGSSLLPSNPQPPVLVRIRFMRTTVLHVGPWWLLGFSPSSKAQRHVRLAPVRITQVEPRGGGGIRPHR